MEKHRERERERESLPSMTWPALAQSSRSVIDISLCQNVYANICEYVEREREEKGGDACAYLEIYIYLYIFIYMYARRKSTLNDVTYPRQIVASGDMYLCCIWIHVHISICKHVEREHARARDCFQRLDLLTPNAQSLCQVICILVEMYMQLYKYVYISMYKHVEIERERERRERDKFYMYLDIHIHICTHPHGYSHTHIRTHTIATWNTCFSVVQEQTLLFLVSLNICISTGLFFSERGIIQSHTLETYISCIHMYTHKLVCVSVILSSTWRCSSSTRAGCPPALGAPSLGLLRLLIVVPVWIKVAMLSDSSQTVSDSEILGSCNARPQSPEMSVSSAACASLRGVLGLGLALVSALLSVCVLASVSDRVSSSITALKALSCAAACCKVLYIESFDCVGSAASVAVEWRASQ